MRARGVFRRYPDGLYPDDERAFAMLKQISLGDRVLVSVHKPRNAEFSAMAHKVFDSLARETGHTAEAIKLWLKWETGRIDLIKMPIELVPGTRYLPVPRSFSPESMSEAEFKAFWDDAWPIISAKLLPKVPPEAVAEIRRITRT